VAAIFCAGIDIARLNSGRPYGAFSPVKKRAKVASVRLNNSYLIKILREKRTKTVSLRPEKQFAL
jgi:hypothetical protein